jgi:hypothetical protein
MPPVLRPLEEEIVFLKAIREMIDSLVNRELLVLEGGESDTRVSFRSGAHKRLFNATLLDFLCGEARGAPLREGTYLGALQAIADQPGFSVDDSVAPLRAAVHGFLDWLGEDVEADVFLSSTNTRAALRMSRLDLLALCGDLSRRDILRSMGVAEELRYMLADGGTRIGTKDALLALDDFHERFHAAALDAHVGAIAEHLNGIRWGIHEYLQPEYRRSLVWEAKNYPTYRYVPPEGVTSGFAEQCFWELMEGTREEPRVRRFAAAKGPKTAR